MKQFFQKLQVAFDSAVTPKAAMTVVIDNK